MNQTSEKIVLIVEDEPDVLSILAEYLQDAGYRVLKAESATLAFDILASKPHLDLLITDYRLPGGVSGVAIAEPALKLRPDLKVIFISGYPAEIHDSGSPITRQAPVLAKPFALDSLHRQIRQLLA
jgi:DNA-binding NtrC family response regulator